MSLLDTLSRAIPRLHETSTPGVTRTITTSSGEVPAELLRDLTVGPPAASEPAGLREVNAAEAGAAEASALRPGAADPRDDPLADQVPLELDDRREHVE